MKSFARVVTLAVIIALAFGAFGNLGGVQASARTASWVVSVTYENVGTAATPVTVTFYAENSTTPITYKPLGETGTLAPGAGASFYIGSVNDVPGGFRGNAVLTANEPLVATVVQFHQNAQGETFKMRMLSNGFQTADGSNQYLIATTLGNTFDRTTVFSVQNITGSTATGTIKFYNASDGSLASSKDISIPANSSKYIELDNTSLTGLGSTFFNGSAIINMTSGSVVAAASEYYNNKNVGANFEGVPLSRAANKIYMATALCARFGLDTYYAVQNASLDTNASITVQYYDINGTPVTTDGPYPIGPGQKKSITTCSPSTGANMADFTGSAVISSSGAPIVALGKAQASATAPTSDTTDLFTIFNGEQAGASRMAMPFVRWTNNTDYYNASNMGGKQRTYIAVQNLESTNAKFNVIYYDKNGAEAGRQQLSIAGFAKGNTDASAAGALGKNGMNPGDFGYYTDGSFGGAVIIEADASNPTAKFIAIARVQNPGAGEDYNAVPTP